MGTIPGFHPHEPGGIHKVLWSHIRDRRACVWVWERPCAAGRAWGGFDGFPGFVGGYEGAGTPSPSGAQPLSCRAPGSGWAQMPELCARLARHEVSKWESFPEKPKSSSTDGETEARRRARGHGEDTGERQPWPVGCAGRSDPAKIKPQNVQDWGLEPHPAPTPKPAPAPARVKAAAAKWIPAALPAEGPELPEEEVEEEDEPVLPPERGSPAEGIGN